MESARYLADALKVKSEVADHIRLINLLSQDKREQDARDALSELKLQHPSNLKVMALDAVFNRQSDNVDRARQIYNNMRDQAIAEGSVQALIQIARDQYEIGQKADAQLSLAQAQALDPNTLAITIVQTEIFLAEGAYEQALELAEQLVSRAPHQPIGYRLKGDALRDMNRSGPALEAYLDGLEKSGTTLELVLNAYLLKRQQTGLDDAVSFLEDLVRRQPAANYVILRALAAGYADVGKTVQAIALNESLLENQPNDPVVLNNLALVYFESGDQRARDFAQKAYDLAPENYAIMDTLGWILVNRGETGLGVTILRNALARSANIPEIRYHYAVALHRNGQSKAAERELLALLRSGVDFENMDAARSLYQEITGNTN